MRPSTHRFLLPLLAFAVLLPACASAPTAGTGDVAFRLLWDGYTDLDLHVADPAGEHIWFFDPEAESGGLLDVDCNAASDRMCPRPIENVFWPHGAAPEGEYQAWVEARYVVPDEAPIGFELLVLRGERVVERHRGELVANGHEGGAVVFAFAR